MTKLKKELFEWFKAIIIAFAIVMFVNIFYSPTMVYSISMSPTLIEKDFLVLGHNETFDHGDIISFRSDLILSQGDIDRLNAIQKIYAKRNPEKNLIKRVIGLPGESVRISDGAVYINDILLSEPYISTLTTGLIEIDEIPEGYYFVMGDNRSHSTDSRDAIVGLVNENDIVGHVLFRAYPMDRIGAVD